ncbi:MAG: type I-F CRISPR-associated helicase Cas3 [Porticoccaceae bacterium]|nr:type I-F CRISPR-associated helicase Cas3 [Porticoccaceae bacterium]
MNILLVSQCNKNALTQTRRILDQFAERKGERTWQTAITLQGLNTLRKMLKKNARRNTAVACHRIGGKNHSELLWIVGNVNRFNEQGTVPTNTTARDVLKADAENHWHTAEAIALFAGIAALFHDFGKANTLFQKKLAGKRTSAEPYRHEWVSLRLFQAFVGELNDQQWVEKLATVSSNDETALLDELSKLQDHPVSNRPRCFSLLPPTARVVAWLIVSHHKLPQSNPGNEQAAASLKAIAQFIEKDFISAEWNSPQIQHYASPHLDKAQSREISDVWSFPKGTPLNSKTWCDKAQRIAKRMLGHPSLLNHPWLGDTFTVHMARMALMLADHHFSSIDGKVTYRDNRYKIWANTDRKTNQHKQRLDEHLIGVYRNALQITRQLPSLRKTLPAIGRHAGFKKRSAVAAFQWQDKAYDLAVSCREPSQRQGFFGVNLASTGRGKTFANARIMYALANPKTGCRFSVVLGLRTLTLQTGQAFREKLNLDDDDIAVLIGSAAIRRLFESQSEPTHGSESADELVDAEIHVSFEGALTDGPLKHWLENDPSGKLNKLISSPILVSTIDHLMPATEGTRGGKQIAPMLRLLTADLVLDEPDDFSLADMPALCRLVHWAGLLGSRVLLSSATLSPALVTGLFTAYQKGREAFNVACTEPGNRQGVICAWFDEWSATHATVADADIFSSAHQQFIQRRIHQLQKEPPLRRAELLPLKLSARDETSVASAAADAIFHGASALHQHNAAHHPQTHTRVSVGLVRFANIKPLVAVAQQLLNTAPPANTVVHYCVYHSQFPLIVRSGIEAVLDNTLNRKQDAHFWQQPAIKAAVGGAPEKDHIFIVLASPVAEVGRDHDYDWAIAEPSSLRSIIQLAGRIQRHRQHQADHTNLLILDSNIKGYRGSKVAFEKPGFETAERPLISHNLAEALRPEQYRVVDSQPCIAPGLTLQPDSNLADLEHAETQLCFASQDESTPYAHQWLKPNATLTAELQQRTRFRRSRPMDDYYCYLEEDSADMTIYRWHDNGEAKPCNDINRVPLQHHSDNQLWGYTGFVDAITDRAEQEKTTVEDTSRIYGAFSLYRSESNQQWHYTPELGFYQALT